MGFLDDSDGANVSHNHTLYCDLTETTVLDVQGGIARLSVNVRGDPIDAPRLHVKAFVVELREPSPRDAMSNNLEAEPFRFDLVEV